MSNTPANEQRAVHDRASIGRVSNRSRGSYKRGRSRVMDTLLRILKAVDKIGAKGREFSTSELRDAAGISPSQAYVWLQILRAHGFVSGRIVKANRPAGDWRWTRKFRIVRIK